MIDEKSKKNKIYGSWRDMKQRCTNPKHPLWKNYGGRGILVCERWLESFKNFYEDMEKNWFRGASIDRIDNNGNYEPENCRWLLMAENSRKSAKERVENKTHNFLDGEIQRKSNKERVENKTHHLLGKGMMPAFDLWEWKNVRIHKDIYHANRDRYLSLNSKEYKNLKR